MMMAAPMMVADRRHVAEHDEAEHHRPDDHRILIRHHDAGRRQLQRAVDAEQRDDRNARPRRRTGRGCRASASPSRIGDISAPSRNVPPNCDDASTISGVARSERVISIRNANDRLPPSAIIAGQLTVCVDGRSAISTPQKPIRIAVQRRQPTCSPQHDARQRGDEDRRGQIIGDDVGERQIDGGEKEGGDFERREQSREAAAATAARGA